MTGVLECGIGARRWCARLAVVLLWLGWAAPGWGQTSISLSPATLPGGTVGAFYSETITASGGIAPYAFTLTGSLPPGLSLDASSGLISGTPISNGAYPFTITVVDAKAASTSRSYQIDVAVVAKIVPATLPGAMVGEAYLQYMSVSDGGTDPYHFTIAAGSLPPGLTLDLGGTLSGTPVTPGYYPFKINATPLVGSVPNPPGITQDYAIEVQALPLVISPATLPSGRVGEVYTATLDADGVSPQSFFVTSGALPAGLSLDQNSGLISGTPTEESGYSFEITVFDVNDVSGSRSYFVEILAPILTLAPTSLPAGITGTAYDALVTVVGAGSPPYVFDVVSGALPPGLSLLTMGPDSVAVSGIPATPGSYNFVLQALDSAERLVAQAYAVVIAAPTIELSPPALVDGQVGVAYVQVVAASGGTAPYTFAVSSDALPPGLVLDTEGTIAGTPSMAGSYGFKIRATDTFGSWGEQGYMIVVAPPTITLTPATLTDGEVGAAYAQALAASGGAGPYTFQVSSGALPPGLVLSGSGALSGIPDAPGGYPFTVTATDVDGNSGQHDYAIAINAASVVMTPASLPDGQVGLAYSQSLAASGGAGPYVFAVTGGILPPGLALSSDGMLSGTPTTTGSHGFVVTATDAYGNSGGQGYSIAITSPAIVLSPKTLVDGVTGVAYAQSLSASGGTGPYAFAISAGELPPGLVLAAAGELGGTPTSSGSYVFTITATDAFGTSANQGYSIAITSPAIVLSPTTLVDGQVGVAYARMFGASGGTAPYAFALGSGALPPGLVLAGNGALGGTPTAAGSYAFSVTATDGYGASATQSYDVSIAEAAVPLPTVISREVTTPTGTPIQVSMTDGASGGPFTEADVLSTSPADAGTYTVSPGSEGDYVLTFAPTPGFVGKATVRYTLSNATGASDPGTIIIEVTALPDPIADPEVAGLTQAQATIAQVFAQTQVDNVVQRLERLQQPRSNDWGFWVSGGMRRGDLDANGNAEGLAFETSGVTTGADRRFGDDFAFGVAGGLAQDRTLVGSHGSRNDSRAHAAVGYGSFHPTESPFFVNAMRGHQRLSFQLRRYASGSGAGSTGQAVQTLAATVRAFDDSDGGDLLESPRTGGQDFTSVGTGYRHEGKAWTFTTYGRQNDVRTHLDAYDESIGVPGALSFGEQDMRTRTRILGFRADGRKEIRWGTLEPKLKLELQRDASDFGVVAIRYLDQPNGPVYRSTPEGLDNNRLAVEIGATLITKHFLTLRLEYHAMIGGLYNNDNAIIFSLEKER